MRWLFGFVLLTVLALVAFQALLRVPFRDSTIGETITDLREKGAKAVKENLRARKELMEEIERVRPGNEPATKPGLGTGWYGRDDDWDGRAQSGWRGPGGEGWVGPGVPKAKAEPLPEPEPAIAPP